MEKTLTICHLYPDLLDVYADRGNVTVLEKRCAWRGIKTQVRAICAGDAIDFSGADIVLIGTGAVNDQIKVCALRDTLSQPLKAYVEAGGVMLAIGESYRLLGNFFYADGVRHDGLGVLDIDTHETETRFIGHFATEAILGDLAVTLVGFEHHTGKTDIKAYAPFGRVISGYGNDGCGYDGVVYKNTFGTYMHGPILPKNPELADRLILLALEKKYGSASLAPLEDEIARKARSVVLERGMKDE